MVTQFQIQVQPWAILIEQKHILQIELKAVNFQ